jgi:hypothetical protein
MSKQAAAVAPPGSSLSQFPHVPAYPRRDGRGLVEVTKFAGVLIIAKNEAAVARIKVLSRHVFADGLRQGKNG